MLSLWFYLFKRTVTYILNIYLIYLSGINNVFQLTFIKPI